MSPFKAKEALAGLSVRLRPLPLPVQSENEIEENTSNSILQPDIKCEVVETGRQKKMAFSKEEDYYWNTIIDTSGICIVSS